MTQEQFDKAQKTFSKKSLSDSQKQVILSNIYSQGAIPTQPVVSPLSSYFLFFRQKAFIATAVVVLLISGTSYASAQSLPGDLLYVMKVNVLEPIGLALRFSEEAKNEYRISLLKKRVDELEELKQMGEISESSKEDSSRVTNKNIKDLESRAVFNEEGENDTISKEVEVYNGLTDPELEIDTNIDTNIYLNTEVIEETEEESIELELDSGESITPKIEEDLEVKTESLESIGESSVGNTDPNLGI